MSEHWILVIRYGISDPHVSQYGRSKHIHLRYYKRVTVLMDFYVKSLV